MKGKRKQAAAVIVASVLAVAMGACSLGKKNPETALAEPELLPVDSLSVEQIIRPHRFLPAGERMVVQTLEDTVFYVYELPDFSFVGTFGRRGSGPDEFTGFSCYPTGIPGVFSVRTYRGGIPTVELYRAGNDGVKRSGAMRDRGFDPNYGMAYAVINDSLLAAAFIGPSGRHVLRLIDTRTGAVLDTLAHFYQYTVPFAGRNNITRNTAQIAVCGQRMAVAYQETQTLDFYRIGQNRFFHEVSAGVEKSPSVDALVSDPQRSSLAYVAVFAGEKYVYAVDARTDVPTLQEGGQPDVVIEVYAWNGRKAGSYRFSRKGLVPVGVDESRRMVYAVDPRQDFEFIYTCALPL